MRPLAGKVAVVAGATRGAGRGIAMALGEAGATVYCTGRSVRGHSATKGRPECIEESAALVTRAGGIGIPVQVDHTQEDQVAALFARVKREHGKLDVLVNDIWGGDELTEWETPFWELDVQKGLLMMQRGIHTHVITARHGAPLLVEQGHGLLVEVTDGNAWTYRGTLFYDLVKSTVIRLAFDMAEELRSRGVASLALTPGFLRSEAVLDHFGITTDNWRTMGPKKDPNLAASESPLFVGRAVAALAADARVLEKSGRVFASWELAKEYGFVDADGTRPDWGTHFRAKYGDIYKTCDDGFYSYWSGYEAMAKALAWEA